MILKTEIKHICKTNSAMQLTSRVVLTERNSTGPPWVYTPGKFPACRHQQI